MSKRAAPDDRAILDYLRGRDNGATMNSICHNVRRNVSNPVGLSDRVLALAREGLLVQEGIGTSARYKLAQIEHHAAAVAVEHADAKPRPEPIVEVLADPTPRRIELSVGALASDIGAQVALTVERALDINLRRYEAIIATLRAELDRKDAEVVRLQSDIAGMETLYNELDARYQRIRAVFDDE